jgi:hypothetical protein
MDDNELNEEYVVENHEEYQPPPPPPTKLSETDRMALKLANAEKEVALANAKTALAESEKAELNYRYFILQLYRKYGLSDTDALNQNGDILIDGAKGARQ